MRFNSFDGNQGSWTRDYISISSSSENGEAEGREDEWFGMITLMYI